MADGSIHNKKLPELEWHIFECKQWLLKIEMTQSESLTTQHIQM